MIQPPDPCPAGMKVHDIVIKDLGRSWVNAPSWDYVSPSENFQQNRRQLFLASVGFQVVSLTWKVRFKGFTVWFSGRFQGLSGGLFLSVHSLGFDTHCFPRETVETGKITPLVPESLPLLCSPGESAQ